MAQRTISTRISLDGEKEFKNQMEGVNRELRNLGSEMKLAEEKFKGQENSVEALTEKDRILRREIEQQQEKVRALAQAVVDASEAYGKTDRRTDDFRQSLNRAQADLLKMQRELRDTEKALDGVGDEAKDTGKNLEDLGGSGIGGIKNLAGSLGALKGAVVGGVAAMGLDALKDALFEVVDGTAEYRKIMGTLEASSAQAGYSAEQTAEVYNRLYSVLGDNQTAATAAANLQAIGLSQEDLLELTNLSIGAWAKYGDSIPIDSMAEAINMGAQQSEISSGLADALEWAGVNADEFKEQLEAANSTQERAKLIMEALTQQGLGEMAEGWMTVNEDIVNANEAQAKWDEQMGRLGSALSPAKDALISFGADALGFVIEKIEGAIGFVTDLINALKNIPRNGLFEGKTAVVTDVTGLANRRYANGLERVPYDDYHALLHKDEMVLTAAESNALRTLRIGTPNSGAVTAKDLQEVTAAAVNAMAVNAPAGGTYTINLKMNVNGREFYSETIEDFRAVARANPEVSSDR